VDDGSNDATSEILSNYAKANPDVIHVVKLPDRGYNLRKLPANLNLAYSLLENQQAKCDYSMISGDDCVFPPCYSATLLNEMEKDQKLAVASGDFELGDAPEILTPSYPRGAGRFVRESYWVEVGRRYPVAPGWEAWLIYKALQLGYNVKNFSWLRFNHLRIIGSVHRFKHWGRTMRSLGYHPLAALGRIVTEMVYRNDSTHFSASVWMLFTYLLTGLFHSNQHKYDPDLRSFVRKYQASRMTIFLSKKIESLFIM